MNKYIFGRRPHGLGTSPAPLGSPVCGTSPDSRKWRGLRSLWQQDSGQALVLGALSMVVLIGMLALAVDAGMLRHEKRRLQTLADASALAGALELTECADQPNCSTLQQAALAAVQENGSGEDGAGKNRNATLMANCGAPSGEGLELSVNNPPCAVSGDPNSGDPSVVEAVVSEPYPTVFANIFGVRTVRVSARAEALNAFAPCVYLLSQSSAQPSLSFTNSTVRNACGVYLGSSFQIDGGSTAAGTAFFVTGSSSQSAGTVSPTPRFNAPVAQDPLRKLQAPTPSAQCDFTNYTVSTSATLQPGTYCGGLTVNTPATATVTLTPGTYILLGNLSVSGPTLSGSGVTLYLSQGNGYNCGSSTLQNVRGALSAPVSGPLEGVLYFTDPALPAGKAGLSMANVAASTRLDGILYLPGQQLEVSSSTLRGNAYFGLVADAATIQGSDIEPAADFSSLDHGSPLQASTRPAAVIE